MSKESDSKIVDLLEQDRNPLLDEIRSQQDQLNQNLEVDMQRTKTLFGMVVDGLQYLAMQAEGELVTKDGKPNKNVEHARSLLGHFFNVMDRAERALGPRQEKPPPLVIPRKGTKFD